MSRRVNLDYSNFETLGEIKDKYPDSTIVMRKQFVDMAIEHEWNHGRQVGMELGVCTELDPRNSAAPVAGAMVDRLMESVAQELEEIIKTTAEERKLHDRVKFYKEPRF